MMTPTDFENWKNEQINEGNVPLSNEDFEFCMDMMAMQDVNEFNPKDKDIIFKDEGMALVDTHEGLKVFYTDLETIKYEQLLRKQKRKETNKNKLFLIKQKGFL